MISLRAVTWVGVYGLILAAWVTLILSVRANPYATAGVPASFWASLCQPATAADLADLVAMWALMALAMMLPTFVPTLRAWLDLGGSGAANGPGTVALVGGYVAVWLGASLLGAGAQMLLSRWALLTVAGQSQSGLFSAILLIGAGGYQFTRLKSGCLTKCRSPAIYFLGRWRPGWPRAFVMGAELGLVCLGCCWALMALGFVGGTMNLLWMGAATLFMTLEKLPEIGRWTTAPAGVALIAAGLWTLI